MYMRESMMPRIWTLRPNFNVLNDSLKSIQNSKLRENTYLFKD